MHATRVHQVTPVAPRCSLLSICAVPFISVGSQKSHRDKSRHTRYPRLNLCLALLLVYVHGWHHILTITINTIQGDFLLFNRFCNSISKNTGFNKHAVIAQIYFKNSKFPFIIIFGIYLKLEQKLLAVDFCKINLKHL